MIETALVAQVIVWLIAIGMFAASRQASIFHPVTAYLAFHGLVFVLRPILVYTFGFNAIFDYMIYRPSDEIFIRTLEVSSVGMISFLAACLFAGRSQLVFASRKPPEFNCIERRALLVTTLVLIPAMVWSIYATR